jgi:hypothetical protein
MTALPSPSAHAVPWQTDSRQAAPTNITNLKRVRWAVRATLLLGVAGSVAANILHANPNPISQTIAAWPPVALLLTVELISRVPIHWLSLAAARLSATTAIAGIAAWISYWHMAGVALIRMSWPSGPVAPGVHVVDMSTTGRAVRSAGRLPFAAGIDLDHAERR